MEIMFPCGFRTLRLGVVFLKGHCAYEIIAVLKTGRKNHLFRQETVKGINFAQLLFHISIYKFPLNQASFMAHANFDCSFVKAPLTLLSSPFFNI